MAMRTPAFPILAALTLSAIVADAAIKATIDTDEHLTAPVLHRYIHGVIPDDAKFQLALPDNWNGKLVVFSRGFSGTELTNVPYKTAALEKGYAFAASDEGWNRLTIAKELDDTYDESRRRIRELTLYAQQVLTAHYKRRASRTLMMGGSNGGHHTKWMLESHPELYDGGIAGYGFNSQVSQWGSIATVLRHYDVISPRIDDIIAKRIAEPNWNPADTPLTAPLTADQLKALQSIYDIPATLPNGFAYNVGRWPGSEGQWKSGRDGLVGYLRDSMPRFDHTFNPDGGALTDEELRWWEPSRSPKAVQKELRKLDLSGNLKRPVIIMHGTADAIVSPGESAGYQALVERRIGRANADSVLATYFIPGMGHGGPEFDKLIGAQLDALESWIDYRESSGKRGSPAPAVLGTYAREGSQPRNDLPQLYTTTRTWGELPPGVTWAAVTAIETAPDGTIYVVHRCFENSCAGRSEAPILKYNAAGKLLAAFGQGLLIFPHGGTMDRDGNLWITDAGNAPGKGHQVFKFNPDGKLLMTLGKAGVSGSGPDLFDQPTDVVVAPNGELFVTDSHRNGKNNRVMHFTRDGKFIKEWGRKGTGRGELSEPHTLAIDSRGRLFVGDRENNRIVIDSQDGQVLDEWRQFGRPSGIAITADDTIYVADSESWGTDTGARELPGIKKGIRIGSARDGRVTAFIEDQESTAADHAGAEGVGVDAQGNVYGGVVRRRMLERHVRKQQANRPTGIRPSGHQASRTSGSPRSPVVVCGSALDHGGQILG